MVEKRRDGKMGRRRKSLRLGRRRQLRASLLRWRRIRGAASADPFTGNAVRVVYERVDVYVPETDGIVSFEVDHRV